MQAELTAVAQEIVTVAEPGFDHLTLRATCSGGGGTYRLTSGPSEQDEYLLGHLEKLFAVGLDRPVVFEMRVRADGTFDALVTEHILQATSMLPPTYTVVRKRPKRPDVPPAATLADVEAVIGAPLPAEVHELYARGVEIDDDIVLYPPDEIVLTWSLYTRMADEDPHDWAKPVLYVGPPGAVPMVSFHPLLDAMGTHSGWKLTMRTAPGGPTYRTGFAQSCGSSSAILV